MIRTCLTDTQWEKMEPHCHGKPSDPGRTGGDNRLFLEAVLWIARTGSPWRDLPAHFGKWNTVFKRYRDWVNADVFKRIFEAVSDDPDMEYAMVDGIVLSDAYLANASSDWRPPDVDTLPDLTALAPKPGEDAAPFARDASTLARAWTAPGTPGRAHRIGGLEKQAGSGHISYDPENHAEMVHLRADKIARVAERRPAAEIDSGAEEGDVMVVGWGSTYGAIRQAVRDLSEAGHKVSHVHLRQLWPLPRGLAAIMSRFGRIVCPELNSGQLAGILRGELLRPVEPIGQVTGQPFRVDTLKAALLKRLGD